MTFILPDAYAKGMAACVFTENYNGLFNIIVNRQVIGHVVGQNMMKLWSSMHYFYLHNMNTQRL